MSDNVRIALITGAAALVGGLVAGGASVATTVVNQNGEDERIERKVDEQARGAARVLISRFATTLSYTGAMLAQGRFAAFAPTYIAPVSADDLELITARLSVDSYRAVDIALRDTTSFFVLLKAGGAAGDRMTGSDREDVRLVRADILHGLNALLPVADLPSWG